MAIGSFWRNFEHIDRILLVNLPQSRPACQNWRLVSFL